jgi:hypothetical protein
MKLNTKPLKFKCCQNRKKKEQQILFIKSTNLLNLNAGWLTGKGGGGWSTHARHGYPHLVLNKLGTLKLVLKIKCTFEIFITFKILIHRYTDGEEWAPHAPPQKTSTNWLYKNNETRK